MLDPGPPSRGLRFGVLFDLARVAARLWPGLAPFGGERWTLEDLACGACLLSRIAWGQGLEDLPRGSPGRGARHALLLALHDGLVRMRGTGPGGGVRGPLAPAEGRIGAAGGPGPGAAPTVGRWLDLIEERREEAGAILEALARIAAARVPHRRWDSEDAAHDVEVLALIDGCAALWRVPSSTPLLAWLRGCVHNLRREKEKEKEKERERERAVPLDDVPCSSPSPLEVVAEEDASRHEKQRVLKAARVMPRPYGHVLVWRFVDALSWQQIRDRLNSLRAAGLHPIGDRQVQAFLTKAMQMLKEWTAGSDLREAHRQKYLPKKNPWIDSSLPPFLP